jgi:hypothetical protein
MKNRETLYFKKEKLEINILEPTVDSEFVEE